jgi:hypothetical protein
MLSYIIHCKPLRFVGGTTGRIGHRKFWWIAHCAQKFGPPVKACTKFEVVNAVNSQSYMDVLWYSHYSPITVKAVSTTQGKIIQNR